MARRDGETGQPTVRRARYGRTAGSTEAICDGAHVRLKSRGRPRLDREMSDRDEPSGRRRRPCRVNGAGTSCAPRCGGAIGRRSETVDAEVGGRA